ncbi:hypothetical protein IWQ62_003338 [Dispira parvispora]|uniref:SWIM-type domain-containing protein n=1 Tax=Dispira parvispora TaxID=1520584 RepID=A0A9W8ANN2_9FUNG|nr:hypothetical protein IWQ62_003338 [Dispira parvispora]
MPPSPRRSSRLAKKAEAQDIAFAGAAAHVFPASNSKPTEKEKRTSRKQRTTPPPAPSGGTRKNNKTTAKEPRAKKAAKKPTSSQQPATSQEKRKKRWINEPPQKMAERIERARHQEMYLVHRECVEPLKYEFRVLGNSKKMYQVTITHLPNCSCIDFRMGNHCKHILFVMMKIIRLPAGSPLIYQKAWLTNELEDMFKTMVPDPAALADTKLVQAYERYRNPDSAPAEEMANEGGDASQPQVSSFGVRRRLLACMQEEGDSDHCPVCYDDMTKGDWENNKLSWCQRGCGNNIHTECFKMWESHYNGRGQRVNCVYCRYDWVQEKSGLPTDKKSIFYEETGMQVIGS